MPMLKEISRRAILGSGLLGLSLPDLLMLRPHKHPGRFRGRSGQG